MFTGLVEETGSVERIEPTAKGIRLTVRAKLCARGLKRGDSLAVNGCCLTVVRLTRKGAGTLAQFDLLAETWQRTNFQSLSIGSFVNLERPLRADGRLGGHFVTGHIDGTGTIKRWERRGDDWLLEIRAASEIMRYVVFKGSVAVDGISLTVAAAKRRSFQVWIIPHTYQVTTFRVRRVGDTVNIETDILGKYIEQFAGASHRLPDN